MEREAFPLYSRIYSELLIEKNNLDSVKASLKLLVIVRENKI